MSTIKWSSDDLVSLKTQEKTKQNKIGYVQLTVFESTSPGGEEGQCSPAWDHHSLRRQHQDPRAPRVTRLTTFSQIYSKKSLLKHTLV